MTAFEAVGRGSIPRWDIFDARSRMICHRQSIARWKNICPWSVVDARDPAKVVDQVQLLTGTLNDADVTRRGGGLQSRIQWVRLPPAS